MQIKLLKLLFYKMSMLSLKKLKKKKFFKNDTMNKSDLGKIYNFPIYPRDSKIYSDKRFINNDNEAGTHWCCFLIK